MVTLRTYSNPVEAAIAKSRLDDHKDLLRLGGRERESIWRRTNGHADPITGR